MTHRVHVKAELELFVDDASALRQSAFERMRSAWKGDDEFPYESADDVPIEQAVASALADALPIEFPGARRSALSIDAEAQDSDHDGDTEPDTETQDSDHDGDTEPDTQAQDSDHDGDTEPDTQAQNSDHDEDSDEDGGHDASR